MFIAERLSDRSAAASASYSSRRRTAGWSTVFFSTAVRPAAAPYRLTAVTAAAPINN